MKFHYATGKNTCKAATAHTILRGGNLNNSVRATILLKGNPTAQDVERLAKTPPAANQTVSATAL